MFDIGFSELLLVMIIGLVVLGPERLPVAVKTVAGWIRTLRSLAASVQNELTQELKLHELQESLKKAENLGLQNLTPELKASMKELKEVTSSMQKTYQQGVDELKNTANLAHITDNGESVKTPEQVAVDAESEPQILPDQVSKTESGSVLPAVSASVIPAQSESATVAKKSEDSADAVSLNKSGNR